MPWKKLMSHSIFHSLIFTFARNKAFGHVGHDTEDVLDNVFKMTESIGEPPVIVHELPAVTRCSCCHVVSSTISGTLRQKMGSRRALNEDEYVNIVIDLCKADSVFSGYSVGEDAKLARVESSLGMPTDAETDSRWRRTLQATCEEIRTTVGEDTLWEMFLAGAQEIPAGRLCTKEVRLCPRETSRSAKRKKSKDREL